MARIKKVLINSTFLGLQHIAVTIISIFVIGYIARKLGVRDYGIFSLAFTFPQLFVVFGNMGLRTVTVREIARDRESMLNILGKMVPPRIILLSSMFVLVMLTLHFMKYDEKTDLIICLATVSLVIELISRMIYDVFQAVEEMAGIAMRDVLIRLFTGFLSVSVLYFGYGIIEVCWCYILGAVLGLLVNLSLFNRCFSIPKFQIDQKYIRSSLKAGVPFALTGFISAIYMKIDIVMLSKMIGDMEVGIYSASTNIIYKLIFFADVIATASFPAISQLYYSNKDESIRVFSQTLALVFACALPIMIGGLLLSEDILVFVYGNDYIASAESFNVLSMTLPIIFLSTLFNYVLGAINRQKLVLNILIISTILNICINMLAIPRFGAIGAAWATFLAALISCSATVYYMKKHFKIILYKKLYGGIVLASLMMMLMILMLKPYGVVTSIIGGSLIFTGSMYIFKNEILDIYLQFKMRR